MPRRSPSVPSPVQRLLTQGNLKLGIGIYSFSLPAGGTCPGASPACAEHCYAKDGLYVFRSVQERLTRNLEATQRPDFVGRLLSEMRRLCPGVVRIHCSGDFYSADYTRQWTKITAAYQGARFFSYTRSWRLPEIRPELDQLARLRNMRLWFSCDKDTGVPSGKLKRVRLAWMQTALDDLPPKADLVFRIKPLRPTVVKRIGLALVCPVENGATEHRTDCGRCRVCWEPERR